MQKILGIGLVALGVYLIFQGSIFIGFCITILGYGVYQGADHEVFFYLWGRDDDSGFDGDGGGD